MILPRRTGRWRVDHIVATAAEAHRRELSDTGEPEVWVIETSGTALALGSSQSLDVVDHDAAARLGVEVVKRRSGGGAVLLVPGELAWVDVVVPRGDRLWDDDVARASHWLGNAWAETISAFGRHPRVHVGSMLADDLARTVCFAGVGPGEVLDRPVAGERGPKLVGLSQRRTRDAARFQCAALVRWDPTLLGPLLPRELDAGAMARLPDVATGIEVPVDELVAGFLTVLGQC